MQRIMRITVFWDVIPCSLVEIYQLSGGTSHIHLQEYIGLQIHGVQLGVFLTCHHKNSGRCYIVTWNTFKCVFSNNAVSGSDYTALNDRILVNWEWNGRKWSWPISKYYNHILEFLVKTTKTLCSSWGLDPGTSQIQVRNITTSVNLLSYAIFLLCTFGISPKPAGWTRIVLVSLLQQKFAQLLFHMIYEISNGMVFIPSFIKRICNNADDIIAMLIR